MGLNNCRFLYTKLSQNKGYCPEIIIPVDQSDCQNENNKECICRHKERILNELTDPGFYIHCKNSCINCKGIEPDHINV